MAPAKKSSLYRQQVTEAAVRAVLMAVERFSLGVFHPTPLRDFPDARGRLRPPMKQADRAIDWQHDATSMVLAKLNAADGFPGVADSLFNEPCHLFDAWPEDRLRGRPGEIIGRRETALLRATRDGAVWIGHVRREGGIKLPATVAFAQRLDSIPELPLETLWPADHATWQDIRYEEAEGVGFLHFDFYNGAMGTRQCQRLREVFLWAAARPTQAIVLMGGGDFWSNGLHLNLIEQADSPAEESLRNVEAMDDLAETVLRATSRLVIAALQGNTGAGGCFLARTADLVWVRDGVILNPHYKNMGNLYGSEFWTYLLPTRVGEEGARAIMNRRLPMTARESVASGFYDACLASDPAAFRADVVRRVAELAASGDLVARLRAKRDKRERDEAAKPLSAWRAEELARMERNFYGFDSSYHVARWHFVRRSPQSWTPRHLAKHREPGFASDGEGVTSGETTNPRGTL
jgi:putative two-component system hydrogenase maturation factor HypX/HoxX